jgi:hypothetical protein
MGKRLGSCADRRANTYPSPTRLDSAKRVRLPLALGQVLTSRFGGRVYAEFTHPVLADISRRVGRPPSVDFVYCGDKYPNISLAVETKWAGSSHTSIKTILWDVIRLEMLAHHYSASCIFLFAGKRAVLKKLLEKMKLRGATSCDTAILLHTTSNATHGMSLLPHPRYKVKLLRELFKEAQDIEIPHRIITRRSSPFPMQCPNNNYQVYRMGD